MPFSRRDAFKLGGLGALGATALAVPLGNMVSGSSASQLSRTNMPTPYQAAFQRLSVLQPVSHEEHPADGGRPIDYYEQTQQIGLINVLPGMSTPVVGYSAYPALPPVQGLPNPYGVVPGQRIDVNQYTRIDMKMRNRLPATHPDFGTPTRLSTHLHGSASLPQYDGYASDTTEPGWWKHYVYPNVQPARTLWYHDHGVHHTGENVYSGLATQYHLHDAQEKALLPTYDSSQPNGGSGAEFDVGLIVSDMMFQANGHQLFDDRSHSGLWGDVILVNGKPWPVMKVKRRVYRFRVLNASISRSYRFTLSPQVPMCVVGTDGGLMKQSQAITQWRHGTAERYEVLIDFSGIKAGTRVELKNLSNPNNRDYDNTGKVMAFDVIDDAYDTNTPTAHGFPTDLDTGNKVMALNEKKSGLKVRNIRVEHSDTTNLFTLNGHTWNEIIDTKFQYVIADPGLGDTEIWDIENKSGGWFHPVHIHLIDFKVVSRNGKPPFAWELGPKDVVYVGEGEKVRLIMRFGDPADPDFNVQTGRYMIHCHNLVHEDHDMMSQFSVGLKQSEMDTSVGTVWTDPCGYVDPFTAPIGTDKNHPVKADPPKLDTAAS